MKICGDNHRRFDASRRCFVKIFVETSGESAGYCQRCGAKVVSYVNDNGRQVMLFIKDGEMRKELW